MTKQLNMAKNTESRTQGAKPLMERAEIMAVAHGAKKTGNTKCEINIHQKRKVGEVGMTIKEWAKDFKSYINELDMPRDDYKGIMEYIDDAIALLKEQENAKVVFGRCKDGSFATECGHCGTYLDKAYSICPKCNKELDWNSNQD